MAIFSFHADIVKRSTGRSSVAAAAYRVGEKMRNERTGEIHDYTRKTGVVYSEIILPENAPHEYMDRYTFWNAVEKADKRWDSQTARTIDVALPIEFDRSEQIEIMQKYIQDNFISHGMCADLSIHDTGDGNPHAHIMLTMRNVTEAGFGNKNRDWNQTPLLEQWRENWANACNERFKEKGLDVRISHLSLEAQGIDREPTIHVGVAGTHMEKRGLESDRARLNREIIARNEARAHEATPEATAEYIHELREAYIIVDKEVARIKQNISDLQLENNRTLAKAEAIDERFKHIQSQKAQITEKKANRQEASTLSRLHEQAVSYFKQEFRITPEEANAEMKRLESQSGELERTKKTLEDRLSPLLMDREAFKAEYHKRRLLAYINRDRARVLARLERLEKETRDKLSPKEIMSRLKITNQLDRVERERVRERNRYIGR